MEINEIRKIPIAEYLASLGYHPTKNRGNGRLSYKAVWRNGDNETAVTVNTEKNVWYDYVLKQGGGVIDLCMIVKGYTDTAEALKELTEWAGGEVKKVPVIIPDVCPTGKAQITGITEINNWRLLDYFRFKRCIEVKWLQKYCKQIYYTIEGKEKKFYAVGMENKAGGWVYRSASDSGKGCIGTPDITVISDFCRDSRYMVFEGFTNFLSYLTLYGEPVVNVIILNSVSNTDKAINYLQEKKPKALYLLLDNDKAGDNATNYIIKHFEKVSHDKRSHYREYNDLNDYLKAQHGKE